MKDNNDGISRRKFLKGTVVGGLSATAGCIGPLSKNKNNQSDSEPFSHPSANGFTDQPILGPEPSTETPVIVAFEDPSCGICASFHKNTLQELKSKYIDNGELTFVYRGVDFVYPWGGTATLIIEAVYIKKPDRVFDVINAYYNQQSEFSQSNVSERSRQLLKDLGIKPEPIIQASRGPDAFSNLKTDRRAANSSGATATPTFHLFVDGQHKTKIVGFQNTSVFENVLGL